MYKFPARAKKQYTISNDFDSFKTPQQTSGKADDSYFNKAAMTQTIQAGKAQRLPPLSALSNYDPEKTLQIDNTKNTLMPE